MKPLLRIFFILTITFVISCNTKSKNEKENKSNDTIFSSPNKFPESSRKVVTFKNTQKDSVVNLKFKDIHLLLNAFLSEEETEINFDNIQNDTLHIYLGYDSKEIENKVFSINNSSLKDLTIEQSYMTSIGVYLKDEGYCELDDWKYYQSKWKTLKVDTHNRFLYSKYSYEESRIFNTPIEDVKKEVLRRCGDKTISKIKSVNEAPCEVSISVFILRIKGKRIDDEKAVTIYITFEPPSGC